MLQLDLLKTIPRSYQHDALEFAIQHRSIPLLMGYGLGKTVISLYIATLKNSQRILAVVPKDLFQYWTRQIKRHSDFTSGIAIGKSTRRLAILKNENINITLINPEGVRILKKELILLAKAHTWDTLIIDELTRFRRWNKQTNAMTQIARYIPTRIGLSGGLVTERLTDVFNPFRILFQEASPYGRSFHHFREKYFTLTNPQIFKYEPTSYGKNTITKILHKKAYIRTIEDCHEDLPSLEFRTRTVSLSQEQRAVLDSIQNDMSLPLEDETRLLNYTIECLVKAHQVISGFVYQPEPQPTHFFKYNPKLQTITAIIEEFGTDPFVIWYKYKAEGAMLRSLLKKLNKRTCTIENWQDFNRNPHIDCYLGSFAKSEGIELQRANHAIFFTRTWDNDLYRQAIGRTRRDGGWFCTYDIIYTKTAIDNLINKLLKEKADLIQFIREQGPQVCQVITQMRDQKPVQ